MSSYSHYLIGGKGPNGNGHLDIGLTWGSSSRCFGKWIFRRADRAFTVCVGFSLL